MISPTLDVIFIGTEGPLSVTLTETMAKLYGVLTSEPSRVFTPEELYERVWGCASLANSSRTLETTVCGLRKRLRAARISDHVVTVRGRGYCFRRAK